MPPPRSPPVGKPLTTFKTERTHEENQERAYIAASRRTDRSLEARVESARRASEIHKRRTGRALKVSEADVLSDEMYEEEDDDLPLPYRQLTQHLTTGSAEFNRRLAAYLTHHVAVRSALAGILRDSHNLSANGALDSTQGGYTDNASTMYTPPFFAHVNSSPSLRSGPTYGASGQQQGISNPEPPASQQPSFGSFPWRASRTQPEDVQMLQSVNNQSHRNSLSEGLSPTTRPATVDVNADISRRPSYGKPTKKRKDSAGKVPRDDVLYSPMDLRDDDNGGNGRRKRAKSSNTPHSDFGNNDEKQQDLDGATSPSTKRRGPEHHTATDHPINHLVDPHVLTPNAVHQGEPSQYPFAASDTNFGFFDLSLPQNAQELLFGGFDMTDPLAGSLMNSVYPAGSQYPHSHHSHATPSLDHIDGHGPQTNTSDADNDIRYFNKDSSLSSLPFSKLCGADTVDDIWGDIFAADIVSSNHDDSNAL